MAAKPLPDAELLHKVLRYEPETGALYWRERTPELFPASDPMGQEARCALWNRRHAGRQAFKQINKDGYCYGTIFRQIARAHRIIWKMITGQEPPEIDHIDGDPANNRFANLRAVDARRNSQNKRLRSDSRSGVQGVAYRQTRNTWRARITVNGQRFAIGEFRTKEEAIAARLKAERANGFHPNHGRKT